MLREHAAYLRLLARVAGAEYYEDGERPKGAATAVVGTTEIYLPLDELTNLDEEHARLNKEVIKVADELQRVQKKLANADFLSKAKEEVVRKERDKAVQYEDKLRALNQSVARIAELLKFKSGRD